MTRERTLLVTKTRLRTLLLPVALAVLAVVLVGAYIISYRNSVNDGAELVKVMVAARDIPAGTDGSAVASGGYLKTQTVPRRAVVPGSVVSAAPLTSLVAKDPIYKGEQVTLRQFGPISQGGIFAKFSGKQRAVAVLGEPTQLLAGTLSEGDSVDVVATAQYTSSGLSRATTRVVLRNLLVLEAPDAGKEIDVSSGEDTQVTLVMTDRQAQTMGWAMKNSTWFLALRPTSHPKNSSVSLETLRTFLGRALPPDKAAAQIAGDFSESTRG
jgi:Flp pilus assembly protein CpaB